MNKKLLRVLQKGAGQKIHKNNKQTQQRQTAKSNATKTAAQFGALRFSEPDWQTGHGKEHGMNFNPGRISVSMIAPFS